MDAVEAVLGRLKHPLLVCDKGMTEVLDEFRLTVGERTIECASMAHPRGVCRNRSCVFYNFTTMTNRIVGIHWPAGFPEERADTSEGTECCSCCLANVFATAFG